MFVRKIVVVRVRSGNRAGDVQVVERKRRARN